MKEIVLVKYGEMVLKGLNKKSFEDMLIKNIKRRLKKLGKFKKNRRMEDWLNLINAETEGDLMAIQQTTQIPEVKDTIVMLRQLSADEQVRMEAHYREKRLHDEATALGSARREERDAIVENMRKNGFTEEQIKLALGDRYSG